MTRSATAPVAGTKKYGSPEVSGTSTANPVATMWAIVQDHYGDAETLRHDVVARPDIGAREVLIEVLAAGVERGAWHVMTGKPYAVRLAGYGIRAPKQPVQGQEVAGRVVAVGSGVTRWSAGD